MTADPAPVLRHTVPDEPDRAELAHLSRLRRQAERRALWRAARMEIDGRMVAPIPAPWHGKAWVYDDYCCRCEACSEAKYQVQKASRDRANALRRARRARRQGR